MSMKKQIKGEYRLFKKGDNWGIEKNKDMDKDTSIVFVGMLLGILAHENKVTQEKMAEILIVGNKSFPLEFEE